MPALARLMALITALGLIGGCATAPTKQMFVKYAGPTIPSFTYLGHFNGIRPLGGNDVVIWTTINDPYLITVVPPCPNLPFATKVNLTDVANTVTAGVDWVIIGNADIPSNNCLIGTIRHVDYLAMKQAGIAGP
jgi:hypothetical protein